MYILDEDADGAVSSASELMTDGQEVPSGSAGIFPSEGQNDAIDLSTSGVRHQDASVDVDRELIFSAFIRVVLKHVASRMN